MNLDGKNSLKHFDAKEAYLHPRSRSVSLQKCLEMFCFHHFQVFTRCRFQNVSVRVPFSRSTVFRICRQKLCRFHVNGRPIRHIFHRFQNVPASCERSLRPRLHGIGSKRDRIHLDPIHFLRGVYTGSDPELLAFTRDRIHLDFMNS